VAVAAFLDGRIRWIAIPDVLLEVLSRHDGGAADSADAVIDADRRARLAAETVIAERFST
jgi:1-deoxy-D-xylulose-5-phosphate reductoisomerase